MDDFLTDKQKQDIFFFNENLEAWVANPLYKMKFAVISNKELKGFFDTFELALGDALSKFAPREFVIQQIITSNEPINFLTPALA